MTVMSLIVSQIVNVNECSSWKANNATGTFDCERDVGWPLLIGAGAKRDVRPPCHRMTIPREGIRMFDRDLIREFLCTE
ncbi:unnamed protein product [Sphagnum balticum]